MIPPMLDEVPVRFLYYYGLWRNHSPFPVRCYLRNQYSFIYLVLFTTPPFGSYRIQGGRYLLYYVSPLVDSLLDVLDFQTIYLSHILGFGPLLLEIGSGYPCDPCWTISLK